MDDKPLLGNFVSKLGFILYFFQLLLISQHYRKLVLEANVSVHLAQSKC